MARKKTSGNYQVPAVQRAFAILDTVAESSFGLTAREISREHSLPYSTCFYILETMCEYGYLERDEATKKYSLGYKLTFLGGAESSHGGLDIRAAATPILSDLVDATHLTGHVAVLDHNEAVYIEKVESPGFIRLHTWVGKSNCLHSSAVGKALILHTPEDQIRKLLPPEHLTRRTDRTITTIEALLADLEESRVRGFTIDDAEDESEGRGMAAPVFSAEKAVIASIGLAGSVSEIRREDLARLGEAVRTAAQRISLRLGYIEDLDSALSMK